MNQQNDHPCVEPSLVWEEEDVKDLYSSRQWPTFIGVPPPVQTKSRNLLTAEQTLKQQMSVNQKQQMPLPVLVWKEQSLRRSTQPVQQKSQNKRKRSVTSEEPENIDQTATMSLDKSPVPNSNIDNQKLQQSKRARTEEHEWSISRLPQAFGRFCLRQFNRMFSIFSSHQSNERDETELAVQNSNSALNQSSPNLENEVLEERTSPAGEFTILTKRKVIFEDLRSRGYFVGPGDVYGGDYCIYKGKDPSQSHSVATIRVCDGKISAKDLLCFSRVQNQVAKSAVLAFQRTDEASKMDHESNDSIGSVGYVVFNFRAVSVRN